MKYISTTIKRTWMNLILEGSKTIEYKVASDYWKKRLEKYVTHRIDRRKDTVNAEHRVKELGINFLCGRECYKYRVDYVKHVTGGRMEIDGTDATEWYEIHLSERLL